MEKTRGGMNKFYKKEDKSSN